MKPVDLAIIGSGFGGSLLALIARKLGLSVALLEKQQHPRFAIGESSTPLANLLLEEIARRYDLPAVLPLAKWGSWRRSHAQLSCGLKRGFSFFHHTEGTPWAPTPDHRNELLVAASPHDGIADTHWFREEFDQFLTEQATAAGVRYLDRVQLHRAEFDGPAAALHGTHDAAPLLIHASLVVDATGPRGFLHRALKLPERSAPHFPPTQTLYSHFTDVQRWDQLNWSDDVPPYPVDDAALHHIFDGGWIWVLRFNNGLTSAGVVATRRLADQLRLREGADAWDRLLQRFPSIQRQFEHAKPRFPFVHQPKPLYLCGKIGGPKRALLPSAAGFVDPLLSTGFSLTLLGVLRLAEAIESAWDTHTFQDKLDHHAALTERELLITEHLLAALYAHFDDFELFTALSMLYFAALSFTETTRRLGHPERAGEAFLLSDHPTFSLQLVQCLEAALSPQLKSKSEQPKARERLLKQIHAAIQPINVAGLNDPARRNWYPVTAEDLLRSAPKLQATPESIQDLLHRSGFVH